MSGVFSLPTTSRSTTVVPMRGDHFAVGKPNVNVSRLVVVGIDRNRELPNPRYLRHANRITQDFGIFKASGCDS